MAIKLASLPGSPQSPPRPPPAADDADVERPSTPTPTDLKMSPAPGGHHSASPPERSDGSSPSAPGPFPAERASAERERRLLLDSLQQPPSTPAQDFRAALRSVPRSPATAGGYLPPPPNTLVLYTTSLRVVRKAFIESNLARARALALLRPPPVLHLRRGCRELSMMLLPPPSPPSQARGLLDTFCYVYVERDVSMSKQFQEELKARVRGERNLL